MRGTCRGLPLVPHFQCWLYHTACWVVSGTELDWAQSQEGTILKLFDQMPCWGESSPCPPHMRHSPYEAGANKKNAASYEASKPLHPQRNHTQISSSGNRWRFSNPLLVVELSIYHSVFVPRHSWCLSNSTGDLATRLFVQNHVQNPEEIPWVLPVSRSGSRITWEVGSGGRNQRSSKRGQKSSICIIWILVRNAIPAPHPDLPNQELGGQAEQLSPS